MQITMTPTDRITSLDGVPVRAWDGTTDKGVRCCVLVHRIVVDADDDTADFEAALREESPPVLHHVDLWKLLGSWWIPQKG
jgi:hypothetical protein